MVDRNLFSNKVMSMISKLHVFCKVELLPLLDFISIPSEIRLFMYLVRLNQTVINPLMPLQKSDIHVLLHKTCADKNPSFIKI